MSPSHEFWQNDSIAHAYTNYYLVRIEVVVDKPIPFPKPNQKVSEKKLITYLRPYDTKSNKTQHSSAYYYEYIN
jgi:hypothetical protein